MFSRAFSRAFPITFQLLKDTATRNSKNLAINFTSYHVAPTYVANTIPRRLYAEQVAPEVMTVDYEQVKNATEDTKVLIVDVREPDEIKEHGKIPNSINIPLGNVTSSLSTMPENEFQRIYQRAKPTEGTEIIFYCMIGKRSGMAQQNVMNLGFKNVKNYLGSWTDWANKTQTK